MPKTFALFWVVALAPLFMAPPLKAVANANLLRDDRAQERRVLRVPETGRRPRRVRRGGDRRRNRGIGASFRRAGASAGHGGKEFGKGMGGFGKHTGIGVAKIGKKIGKGTALGVKRVFAP